MQRQRRSPNRLPPTTARATSGNRAPESISSATVGKLSSPCSVDVWFLIAGRTYHQAFSVGIPTRSKNPRTRKDASEHLT